MATAMVWTILCDSVPAVERTTAFYQISALGIILSAILNPIAAWLMSMDPWLPMWIGIICMVLGTFSALLVPETLRLRKEADASHRRRGSSASEEALLPTDESGSDERPIPPKAYAQELLLGAKKNVKHIWRFIIASKSVMLLVAALGFLIPIKQAFESFMLQYTTKRFDWTWSTVSIPLSLMLRFTHQRIILGRILLHYHEGHRPRHALGGPAPRVQAFGQDHRRAPAEEGHFLGSRLDCVRRARLSIRCHCLRPASPHHVLHLLRHRYRIRISGPSPGQRCCRTAHAGYTEHDDFEHGSIDGIDRRSRVGVVDEQRHGAGRCCAWVAIFGGYGLFPLYLRFRLDV